MQSLGDSQVPKLSAVLNNCPVHALTPEIKKLVLALGEISHGDQEEYDAVTGGNYPAYELLKTTFVEYYEIELEEFTWQDFARTLQHYNAWDVQHVLGPVLRKFMKVYVGSHDFTEDLAAADGKSAAAYVNSLTEIQDDYRYKTLSPDQVAMYIGFPLGFSVIYHKQDQEVGVFMNTSPGVQGVLPIEIYHSGEAEGGSGHFERTDGAHRSRTFADKEQKLLGITELLNQPLTVQAGENLLKRYINANLTSVPDQAKLADLADIEESISQIRRCMLEITDEDAAHIPNRAARLDTFSLLAGESGEQLTKDTEAFIANILSPAAPGKANQDGALPSASMIPDGMFVPNSSPVVAASMKIHTRDTTTAAVAPANPTSAVATVSLNPAASADRLKPTPTSASVKTGSELNAAPGITPASTTSQGVAKGGIPNSQAGASASGAQTPDSKQHIDTVLQNKAGPASAAVRTASTPQNQPKVEPAFPASTPSQTVGSTTSTIPASATSTNQQSSVHLQIAASPGSPSSTADHTAPAAGTALSASLILETALASRELVTPIEEKLLADQTSHGTTENFQKMVIDLIIIHRVGALVLAKDSPLLETGKEKEIQERKDLEIAKQAQKEEFDEYYRKHR